MGVNFLTTHVINFVRNKTLTFRELYLYVSPYGHSDLDISMYSINWFTFVLPLTFVLPPNGLSQILPNQHTECSRVDDYTLGF